MSGLSNDDLAFGGFRLEADERRLTRDGAPVELNQRYLDALLLLARHPGELITKDRFMAEVWRGIPVTDEALTQCIRSLRRALGDEAARPRFIETVPKHGYRFVAPVTVASGGSAPAGIGPGDQPSYAPAFSPPIARSSILLLAAAGLAGGAAAGLAGGIGYGLLAATDPPAGTGAISILLVMICLCLMVGVLGGLGVGAGIGLGRTIGPGRLFPVMLGGALGGLVVGALGRLVGLDAFALLVGSRPVAITGGSEGLLIGAIAGAAFWLAERGDAAALPRLGATAALLGSAGGLLVILGGGQMMAGSLAVLAAQHPGSLLGSVLGDLPPAVRLGAGAVEGATFIAALALSFALALRARPAA